MSEGGLGQRVGGGRLGGSAAIAGIAADWTSKLVKTRQYGKSSMTVATGVMIARASGLILSPEGLDSVAAAPLCVPA